ncbi:MAG: hypothetical protein HY650_04805 [Acidobacteria bacterium]|nr:hypothetical protein [Acidobacteriota bacterium]
MIFFSRVLSLLSILIIAWAIWRLIGFTLAELPGRTGHGQGTPAIDPARQMDRWLGALRLVFILFAVTTLVTHGYWALMAAGPLREDPYFVQLKRTRDQRNRRIEESGLRGWIFDRTGSVDAVLAGYRFSGEELIRHYPLGARAVHVIGYHSLLRGSAGAESAYGRLLRSSLSSWNLFDTRGVVGEDLRLTLDRDLQRAAAEQLERTGKPGAVVLVEVDTGNVIAMASAPGFDPSASESDARWNELRADPRQPFVNRALHQYYLPGSTFKVVVGVSALENGLDQAVFECRHGGYQPPGSRQAILDDGGEEEIHGRIALGDATRFSCNQYFAQLGVELGHERLARTSGHFGLIINATPQQSRARRIDDGLWNSDNNDFLRVFSPNASRMVLGSATPAIDLALESIGQGYLQVTPLQMALVAASLAHASGEMPAPRLDLLNAPVVRRRPLTPQLAESMRQHLRGVTNRPGGTAYDAFGRLLREGLSAGGKTGTAQFEQGGAHRVDSWFIGFAPADRPQVACAVVVEGGGYGGRVAAPIAASLLGLSRRQGLITLRKVP